MTRFRLVVWIACALVLGWALRVSGASCGFAIGRSLCRGDIDCDCRVEVHEIQRCVNAALYEGDFCRPSNPWCESVADISHCDRNCNFDIEVDELVSIVNFSLDGCFSPCYSGFDYPVPPSNTMCTYSIFRQLFCQTGGGPCSRTQCPSC